MWMTVTIPEFSRNLPSKFAQYQPSTSKRTKRYKFYQWCHRWNETIMALVQRPIVGIHSLLSQTLPEEYHITSAEPLTSLRTLHYDHFATREISTQSLLMRNVSCEFVHCPGSNKPWSHPCLWFDSRWTVTNHIGLLSRRSMVPYLTL
jgi:hypothetical protein